MGDTPEAAASGSRVLAFFRNNPWIGVAGSIASILSIVLALYLYLRSATHPELVYYVNPARTIVVKQGSVSRLSVSFDGRPLSTDVTACQVAIWNRGRQAIRRDAILRPLTIRTRPGAAILEATIRKKSRQVISVELDQARLAEGEVSVSWNILEHDDGAVIQLVYAGGPELYIGASGVVEGQPAIRELAYPMLSQSPPGRTASRKGLLLVLGYALIAGAFALLAYTLVKREEPHRKWWANIPDVVLITLLGSMLVAFVYFSVWAVPPDPPFGF
jgi:hypothetical protein